jgi:hypothetical protein
MGISRGWRGFNAAGAVDAAIRVLDADAPERLAFYQLEHCLGVLGWAW